jgi:hypothetical protein
MALVHTPCIDIVGFQFEYLGIGGFSLP